MMTHAYQEYYLNSAQKHIASSFDYAINTCKISGQDYLNMFLMSNVSKKIENGEPIYLSGKSGIEIARDVIEEATGKIINIEPNINYEKTKEYWIGFAITYYQWYKDISFIEIFSAVSYGDLENMYYTLHESDISKFVDIIDDIIKRKNPDTRLKRLRILSGLSQKELAIKSGVSLRSIQMYEQRNKDINKASIEALCKISKILNCNIEDLIEK